MIYGRDAREWRDTRDKVERFSSSWAVFALHAFRACPARRAVSQRGDGILHNFRNFRQDASFVGQIDDVIF